MTAMEEEESNLRPKMLVLATKINFRWAIRKRFPRGMDNKVNVMSLTCLNIKKQALDSPLHVSRPYHQSQVRVKSQLGKR